MDMDNMVPAVIAPESHICPTHRIAWERQPENIKQKFRVRVGLKVMVKRGDWVEDHNKQIIDPGDCLVIRAIDSNGNEASLFSCMVFMD